MKKLTLILFAVLLSLIIVGQCKAQTNTTTRLLKFRTGVQYPIDTAAATGNEGNIWYDFVTGRYRANEGGTNKFLIGGGGGGGGAFWPLSGTASFTDIVDINAGVNPYNIGEGDGINVSREGGAIWSTGSGGGINISYVDDLPSYENTFSVGSGNTPFTFSSSFAGFQGVKYGADYSANFDDLSLPNWGATWKAVGNTTLSGDVNIDAGANALNIGETTTFSVGLSFTPGAATLQADQGGGDYDGLIVTQTGVELNGNVNGLDLTGDIDLTPTSSASEIYYSSYTPTLFNGLNIASSQAFILRYFRIGDQVHISGMVHCTPSAGGNADTSLGMSIPIPSNFNVAYDAAGTAAALNYNLAAPIISDLTNDRITFRFLSPGIALVQFYFECTYVIK